MVDVHAQFVVRRRVAAQLVRDDHAWAAVAPEQLAHQPFGRRLVAAALHQHIEHCAVLIDSPPQPMLPAVDRHDHLIQVPLVAATRGCRTDTLRDRQTELRRPAPHRFVRKLDSPCRQHLLNHAQAEREPVIQPHRVADDVRRKSIALERIGASDDSKTETEAFFMPHYIRRPRRQLDNTCGTVFEASSSMGVSLGLLNGQAALRLIPARRRWPGGNTCHVPSAWRKKEK